MRFWTRDRLKLLYENPRFSERNLKCPLKKGDIFFIIDNTLQTEFAFPVAKQKMQTATQKMQKVYHLSKAQAGWVRWANMTPEEFWQENSNKLIESHT